MNENLDLTKILKDCPEGTKLYSSIFGDVELVGVHLDKDGDYPIEVRLSNNALDSFTKDGRIFAEYNGECMLFPSKEQRYWSKFEIKKPKFDPKTLQPFDRVLVRDLNKCQWMCAFFSHIRENDKSEFKYTVTCHSLAYVCCIPYNEDTKHLVGTEEEAPEFYRYWED